MRKRALLGFSWLSIACALGVFSCSTSSSSEPASQMTDDVAATDDAPKAPSKSKKDASAAKDAASASRLRPAIDPAQALRMAVFSGSCVPSSRANKLVDGIYNGNLFVDDAELLALQADALACFSAKANGCDAVEECVGTRVLRNPACANRCDGTVAVACDDTMEFHVDCAKQGSRVCDDSVAVRCAVPGAPSEDTCDFNAFTTACEEGRPTSCGGFPAAKTLGPECAKLGLACGETTLSIRTSHVCRGAGANCEADAVNPVSPGFTPIGCKEGALEACVNGGATAIDCSLVGVGFTCQTRAKGSFCGLADECDPHSIAASVPTCEGTELVTCNAGKITRVDCVSLGFTGCDAKNGVCTPSVWTAK